MVELVGLAAGATLTLIVVALHYAKGTGWEAPEDISQEVLEQRAATVPETDFPEPYNRSIGGGGATAIPAGEAEGELGEGEEAEEEDEASTPTISPRTRSSTTRSNSPRRVKRSRSPTTSRSSTPARRKAGTSPMPAARASVSPVPATSRTARPRTTSATATTIR